MIRSRRVRPVSPRRAAQNAEYTKRRAEWLIGKSCARCGTTQNLTAHHQAGRQGWRLLDESRWLPLCGSGTTGCHGYVEANKAEAYERGWSLRRVGRAA